MRRLYILSLSILSSLLLLTSCEEDEEECLPVETVDATLIWSGDYAVDGCGFLLKIGEEEYKPSNEQDISDSYKVSSPTPVEAKIIHNKETVSACMIAAEMNSVKVVSLRNK